MDLADCRDGAIGPAIDMRCGYIGFENRHEVISQIDVVESGQCFWIECGKAELTEPMCPEGILFFLACQNSVTSQLGTTLLAHCSDFSEECAAYPVMKCSDGASSSRRYRANPVAEMLDPSSVRSALIAL